MYVLGLTGAKQCGKSSLAAYLAEHHGFHRVRMADALKGMLYAMGLEHQHLEGDAKEVPLELLCGKTPRYAMQTLGTEWGREVLGQQIWVSVAQAKITKLALANPNVRVVVEDIRFPNEAVMVLQLGGKLWRVRRPCVEPRLTVWQAAQLCVGFSVGEHVSEQYWRTLPHHLDIMNTGDVASFHQQAASQLQGD